jgi:peptidyl-prolyl cis-trans isomerase C
MRRAALALISAIVAASTPAGVSTAADDDAIVVRAGAATLRISDIERRLARVPDFQLRALGANPEEARRRFVESVLVPELLQDQAAREQHLDREPWVRARIHEVYHRALRDRLRTETLGSAPVADADVRAYYGAHRSDFVVERRLLLWRILVDDEPLARRILTDARGVGGPDRWKALAREHSRDVATHLRGGSLGFVGPDGHTDVPQVRVDPAIYAAADAVRDGELVPDPVREGAHFAVVWRRGTRAAEEHGVEEVRATIVDVLERERERKALTELLSKLRKAQLTEHHPELIDALPDEGPEDLRPSRSMHKAVPPPSAPARVSADPVPRPAGSVLR